MSLAGWVYFDISMEDKHFMFQQAHLGLWQNLQPKLEHVARRNTVPTGNVIRTMLDSHGHNLLHVAVYNLLEHYGELLIKLIYHPSGSGSVPATDLSLRVTRYRNGILPPFGSLADRAIRVPRLCQPAGTIWRYRAAPRSSAARSVFH